MNHKHKLLESHLKNTQPPRTTAIKTSLSKGTSTNPHPLTTSLQQSLKLRDPAHDQAEVAQFRQTTTEKKQIQHSQDLYARSSLINDVNHINNLYNHVLTMLSVDCSKLATAKAHSVYQTAKITNSIQRLIHQNLQLKVQIDRKYSGIKDLHEIADYLNLPYDRLTTSPQKLSNFLEEYQTREKQLKELQSQLVTLQKPTERTKNRSAEGQRRQKEERCRMFRKQIERQQRRIAKLQEHEQKLLKNLYANQKSILRNQRSNSAIKIKINQIVSQEEYRAMRAQSRSHQALRPSNKQNVQAQNKLKGGKLQSSQKIKSRASLVKLVRPNRL